MWGILNIIWIFVDRCSIILAKNLVLMLVEVSVTFRTIIFSRTSMHSCTYTQTHNLVKVFTSYLIKFAYFWDLRLKCLWIGIERRFICRYFLATAVLLQWFSSTSFEDILINDLISYGDCYNFYSSLPSMCCLQTGSMLEYSFLL